MSQNEAWGAGRHQSRPDRGVTEERAGWKSAEHRTYLVMRATPAVESAVPCPFEETVGNEKVRISSQFKSWASSQNLTIEAALKMATLDLPGNLAPLAKTGDPRGVPLLRKALMSSTVLIVSLGAAGLAQAYDTSSVPMIIAASRRVPASMAPFIADSLKFFNDPQAQSVFAFYFPDVNVEEARKFNGFSPFGPRYTIKR